MKSFAKLIGIVVIILCGLAMVNGAGFLAFGGVVIGLALAAL